MSKTTLQTPKRKKEHGTLSSGMCSVVVSLSSGMFRYFSLKIVRKALSSGMCSVVVSLSSGMNVQLNSQPMGCLSHSVRPRRAAFADCQTTPTTPTHTYAAAAADDAASCQTTPTTPTLPDDSTTPTTPTHTFDSDHAAAAFTDTARRLRLLRRCQATPTTPTPSMQATAHAAR